MPADTFDSNLEICYEILLYLAARLARLRFGEGFEYTTSDPDAPEKIAAWCEVRGFPLLLCESLSDGRSRFLIEKA